MFFSFHYQHDKYRQMRSTNSHNLQKQDHLKWRCCLLPSFLSGSFVLIKPPKPGFVYNWMIWRRTAMKSTLFDSNV